MERLTFDGNFCDIAMCREPPCQHDNNCTQKQVWERLKQYEDTGLTPELLNDPFTWVTAMNLAAKPALGVEPGRLRELAEADKAGRVVVLPPGVLGTGGGAMNSKQTIMQLANEVIRHLNACADEAFVESVLECINDGVEFGEDEIREVE